MEECFETILYELYRRYKRLKFIRHCCHRQNFDCHDTKHLVDIWKRILKILNTSEWILTFCFYARRFRKSWTSPTQMIEQTSCNSVCTHIFGYDNFSVWFSTQKKTINIHDLQYLHPKITSKQLQQMTGQKYIFSSNLRRDIHNRGAACF